MSSWLDMIRPKTIRSDTKKRGDVPEGVWKKCPQCSAALYLPELERNLDVCPKRAHHMRVSARRRLDIFLDEGERKELNADLAPQDRLKFRDTKKYKDRLAASQKDTGENDALITFKGKLKALPVVVAAFEFSFLGGSMGSVVGEKFTQAVNVCIDRK